MEYAHDLPLERRGWRCLCDCGNLRVVKYALLTTGNNVSCGCYRRDRFRSMDNPSILPHGEASFRSLLDHYRRNARKRGHEFSLTEAQFRDLLDGDCAYCGLVPSRAYRGGPKANGAYVCNGVDRVDNALGYTTSNSVSCCPDCNMAKGAMPADRWVAMLDRIASFRGQALCGERSLRLTALAFTPDAAENHELMARQGR